MADAQCDACWRGQCRYVSIGGCIQGGVLGHYLRWDDLINHRGGGMIVWALDVLRPKKVHVVS